MQLLQQATKTAFSPFGKKFGFRTFSGDFITDFVMTIMAPSESMQAEIVSPPYKAIGSRPFKFRKILLG